MNVKPIILLAVILAGAFGAYYLLTDRSPPGDNPAGAEPTTAPDESADPKSSEALADPKIVAPITADPERVEADREAVAGVSPGKLIGRLVDEHGTPVTGASVLALQKLTFDRERLRGMSQDMEGTLRAMREKIGEGVEVSTDPDGRFELVPSAGVDAKTLTLALRARGYLIANQSAKHPGTENVDLGDLLLTRGAVIGGRVYDSFNRPVAGARVQRTNRLTDAFGNLHTPGTKRMREESEAVGDVSGQSSLFDGMPGASREPAAITDEHGAFEMPHAKPGAFSLRITHPDHPPQKLANQRVEVGQVIGDLVVVFDQAATIAGTISGVPAGTSGVYAMARSVETADEGDKSPIGIGRSIVLEQMGQQLAESSVEILADGSFTLRGLDASKQYRVWGVQTGEGIVEANLCADEQVVQAGVQDLALRFERGITLSFRVVSAADEPVTTLKVETGSRDPGNLLSMFGRSDRVDFEEYAGGRVELVNLRLKGKKHFFVRVGAIGFTTLEHPVDVASVEGEVDLGTLVLQSAPTVAVQVVDAASGEPIVGAKVKLALKQTGDRGEAFRRMMEGGRDRGDPEAGIGSAIRALTDNRPRHEVTDANGRCVLNGFPDALSELTVTNADHATATGESFTVSAGESISQKIALHRGGTVLVRVVDAHGDPVADVAVDHREGEGRRRDQQRSDEDGVVRFENLVLGQHRFRLRPKRRSPFGNGGLEALGGQGGRQDLDEWETLVVSDASTQELTLVKSSVGSLSGIVRQNGQVLRGARVKIVSSGRGGGGDARAEMAERMEAMFGDRSGRKNNGKTGGDGKYSLADVPLGDQQLRVTHKSRVMPAIVSVRVHEGENQFDIDLTTTVLTGVVTDPDGDPVVRAQVSVVSADQKGSGEQEQAMAMVSELMGGAAGGQGIKTDDDGVFTLRGIPPGKVVRVRVKKTGFASVSSSELTLTAGETRAGLELQLLASGRVRVTVIDPNGESRQSMFSMSGIQATYKGEDKGVAPSMKVVRNGKCTINGLRAGIWELELKGMRRGGEGQKKTVEVLAGEVVEVRFEK